MSIRDRLETLSRGELTGLVVLIVLTLAGTALWYTRSLPRPVQIAAGPAVSAVPFPGPTGIAAPPGSPQASGATSSTSVTVDVAGWVRRPGVYEFAPGDRVIDAVERAGGGRRGADLSAVNLASLLTDGAQILIPRAGVGVGAGTSGGATGSGGSTLVNINTATEQQLETLSGVGPVLAGAIIQYRTQHGSFHTVQDLLDVSGIGPATLEELRPQVTV